LFLTEHHRLQIALKGSFSTSRSSRDTLFGGIRAIVADAGLDFPFAVMVFAAAVLWDKHLRRPRSHRLRRSPCRVILRSPM